MLFTEHYKSSSIWDDDISENWDDSSWKVVGRNLSYDFNLDINEKILKSSFDTFFHDTIYYCLRFSSGRTCVGISGVRLSGYVIVTADRGEDICCIAGEAASQSTGDDIRKILRPASQADILVLDALKKEEEEALRKCKMLIQERGLSIELTGCEYQWDMKKITFYFKSNKRVDFRDLVKELFKYFKIRIWMSMVNRKGE